MLNKCIVLKLYLIKYYNQNKLLSNQPQNINYAFKVKFKKSHFASVAFSNLGSSTLEF